MTTTGNDGGIVLLVELFVHPGRGAEFRRFETEAARIMRRHGGRIDRVIKPTAAAPERPSRTRSTSSPSPAPPDSRRTGPTPSSGRWPRSGNRPSPGRRSRWGSTASRTRTAHRERAALRQGRHRHGGRLGDRAGDVPPVRARGCRGARGGRRGDGRPGRRRGDPAARAAGRRSFASTSPARPTGPRRSTHVIREHGRLDVLVNNAGRGGLPARVTAEHVALEDWDLIMAANATSVMLGTKHAIPGDAPDGRRRDRERRLDLRDGREPGGHLLPCLEGRRPAR